MSETSKTTVMLKAEAAKGNAKCKALLAIIEIGKSMRETGTGDTNRTAVLKAAQSMRDAGDEPTAAKLEAHARKLPETVRGVTWQDAMKKAEPLLATVGKDFNDVVKNGFTSLSTKVAYSIGLEVGVFEKPEKPAKDEKDSK